MRYVAASYYPRYGDALGTYVALATYAGGIVTGDACRKVEDAAKKAAEFEMEEMPGYCDTGEENCDCSLCHPDIISGPADYFDAKELFTAQELKEHRRALIRGEVIVLYPG